MKILIAIFIVFALSGCVSSERPPQTTYYQLEGEALSYAWEDGNPSVMVVIETIPDYLLQPSLVMQESPHQMYFATYHRWGTDIRKNIRHVLLHDLNAQTTERNFVKHCEQCERVIINIDSFIATAQGDVYLTGTYAKHTGTNDSPNIERHSFATQIDIEQDGYAGAVIAMRQAVRQLASQMY